MEYRARKETFDTPRGAKGRRPGTPVPRDPRGSPGTAKSPSATSPSNDGLNRRPGQIHHLVWPESTGVSDLPANSEPTGPVDTRDQEPHQGETLQPPSSLSDRPGATPPANLPPGGIKADNTSQRSFIWPPRSDPERPEETNTSQGPERTRQFNWPPPTRPGCSAEPAPTGDARPEDIRAGYLYQRVAFTQRQPKEPHREEAPIPEPEKRMVGIAWVYRLRKPEVFRELEKLQLPTGGTWVQLRQRLASYVRSHPGEFLDRPADEPGYKEEVDRTRDYEEFHAEIAQMWPQNIQATQTGVGNTSTPTRPEEGPLPASTAAPANPTQTGQLVSSTNQAAPPAPIHSAPLAYDPIRFMEMVRRWNCQFDGRDAQEFLKRLKELQESHQLTGDQMLRVFPELLRGDAQLWYRNVSRKVTSWDELRNRLRRFFVPAAERTRLDLHIANRRQAPDEPLRAYIIAITALMRLRGGYTEEEELDVIYSNLTEDLRLYIRRTGVKDVDDLIVQADEVTALLATKNARTTRKKGLTARSSSQPETPGAHIASDYHRDTHCWRCGQRGHNRLQCRNNPIRFCARCGKEDTLSRDCPCDKPGNAKRAGGACPNGRTAGEIRCRHGPSQSIDTIGKNRPTRTRHQKSATTTRTDQ
ncbi:uncharacterized protein LOC143264201 [Megachile rotundata]|uniref:uncharacterized protein LOC143264201 n=1 Tax=Megachile rotundata TaxID=143995 RepID=UPI003FD098E2